MRYNIAGMIIDLFPNFTDNFSGFEPFESDVGRSPDAKVYFEGCLKIDKPEGKLLFDECTKLYSGGEEGSRIACVNGLRDKNEIICRFDIYQNWRQIYIKYNKRELDENGVVKGLGQILLRNLITQNQGILIHASSIIWNGIGVIFSAPSGTGKSTHSCLWETYFGAEVINDDAPALKVENGKVFVYGTPWSGKHEKHLNINAPVAAIVVLEQNPENEIRKLTISEAIGLLLPRFLLPYYDNNLLEKAMDVFDRIISSTPVYLLKCRPDREAAELVRQCLI